MAMKSTFYRFNQQMIETEVNQAIVELSHSPTHAWISLNDYCNLKCKHCRHTYLPSDHFKNQDMHQEVYNKIIHQVLPNLDSIIIGGNTISEITIAPKFRDFLKEVESVNQMKNINISIQSNSTGLNNRDIELLTRMDAIFNFSLEAANEESFRKIRGFKLSALTSKINMINEWRQKTNSRSRIVLCFTAMKSNIEDIIPLIDYAEKCSVDEINVMYFVPPIATMNNECLVFYPELIDDIKSRAVERARNSNVYLNFPSLKPIENVKCYMPWYSVGVSGTGDVRFCCLERGPVLGNLLDQNMSEIWNGKRARSFRKMVNSEYQVGECLNCVVRNLPIVNRTSLYNLCVFHL